MTPSKKVKKKKVHTKQLPVDEARTIGYMEGYSDGRNDIVNQFIKFNLLKRNWKKEYNKLFKDDGYYIK